MDWCVKGIVVLSCLFVFWKMLASCFEERIAIFRLAKRGELLFTGFLANIADTLGLGSFAVIVALNNRLKMIGDKQLPGTLNAQSVLPGMLQSLLFLHFVEIDYLLLALFVFAACGGGFLSGFLVAKLKQETVRLLMSVGFIAIGLLVLARQLDLLPLGGEATSLPPLQLCIGAFAMMLAGMLPAIGVGIYAPIQVILFFLGLSPLAAFTVMTTAGSIVQAATAYVFVVKKEVALGESLLITLSGLAGVALAVPLIALFDIEVLRWLLFIVVMYNGGMMWKKYREGKKRQLADAV